MANEYDVVILGAGTGGYVAAIRAAQHGLKVAIVEKEKLGGTCLHKGCIPSKALLRSAEVFATAKRADEFGVSTNDVTLNFAKVQERKNKIVEQLHRGVQQLMKKGKIDLFEGKGRILGPSIFSPTSGTISIERSTGEENTMLIPKNVLIATGSSPRLLPGIEADGRDVLTSDEAVHLNELPDSMLIVGGGVIGLEWASMLNDFGVLVTVLEYGPQILPTEDEDIAKEARKIFEEKGITFFTDAQILSETIERSEEGVTLQALHNGEKKQFKAEKMLLSVGRSPNIADIGIENTSIKIENGAICVNEFQQTEEAHIYAIGDVVGGLQLAHVASHEGIVAVDHLAGKNPDPLNTEMIPKCIYSRPEMASIGLTETEAKKRGFEVKIGTFPFKANGKALIYGESEGFVKLIIDTNNDDILGVHMIGPHVTDMISEAALAKIVDAAHIEVAETIHPHPTLSEVMGEAALAVDGRTIHM